MESPPSGPTNLPPLLENIGHAEWQIQTQSALAQQYFNQGVRLLYGFNFEQAIDAFRAANTHDGGGCAICFWGEAYAVGKPPGAAEVTCTSIDCRSWPAACRIHIGRNLNAGMEEERIPTANGMNTTSLACPSYCKHHKMSAVPYLLVSSLTK